MSRAVGYGACLCLDCTNLDQAAFSLAEKHSTASPLTSPFLLPHNWAYLPRIGRRRVQIVRSLLPSHQDAPQVKEGS